MIIIIPYICRMLLLYVLFKYLIINLAIWPLLAKAL